MLTFIFTCSFALADEGSVEQVGVSHFPWTAKRLQFSDSEWKSKDLVSDYGSLGLSLYRTLEDLKSKQNFRCGTTTGFFETHLTSIKNKKITTRHFIDPLTKKSTTDIFVKQNGEYKEIVRISHQTYNEGEASGRLKSLEITDLQAIAKGTLKGLSSEQARAAAKVQVGWLNYAYLTLLNKALGGPPGRVEVNSPLGREWQVVMKNGDAAQACCQNDKCSQHIRSFQAPRPNSETKRASLIEN